MKRIDGWRPLRSARAQARWSTTWRSFAILLLPPALLLAQAQASPESDVTDRWEFFPCTIGEHPASVFVNVGVADRLADRVPENLITVRLDYRAPATNGLPTDAEFESATAIEDAICDYADARGDDYVGRVTTAGRRQFFLYVADWDDYVEQVAEIGDTHGYQLNCEMKKDPGHASYHEHLQPTADDWQVIEDMRVLEALRDSGDDPSIEREVDHWAFFEQRVDAERFRAWAVDAGYEAPIAITAADGRHCVRLRHRGTMQLSAISNRTLVLARTAAAMDGDYDGWEAPVMTGETED